MLVTNREEKIFAAHYRPVYIRKGYPFILVESACYAGPMSPERKSSSESHFSLEEVARIAREVALIDGYHVPTMIIEGNQGSIIVQHHDLPATFEEKAQLMFTTGFITGRSGEVGQLEQAFFISEAWLSIGDQDRPPNIKPSQDPQRKEILMISRLEAKSRQAALAVFEMIRDGDGNLIELQNFQLPFEEEEGEAESPLLDAFAEGFRVGRRARGH